MPFDEELVLQDGTEILDNREPTSLTRDDSGSVCLDIRQTRMTGLVAHLILENDLFDTGDTMQVTIEHSWTVDGTYDELARFPLITQGDDISAPFELLFATPFRFIRAKIVVTDFDEGEDFAVTGVHVLISTAMLH